MNGDFHDTKTDPMARESFTQQKFFDEGKSLRRINKIVCLGLLKLMENWLDCKLMMIHDTLYVCFRFKVTTISSLNHFINTNESKKEDASAYCKS